MAAPDQKAAAGQQWDEAEIEKALKRLGELHHQASPRRAHLHLELPEPEPPADSTAEQMRNLRSTIPRAIEPLSVHSSPDKAFEALQKSTESACSEIREYKQAATNEEATKVFERARQSRKDNPKGIKSWRARDDPDW